MDVRVGLPPGATLDDLDLHIRVSFADLAAWPVAALLVSGNNETGAWQGWGQAFTPHGPDRHEARDGFVRVFANGQEHGADLPATPFAPAVPPPSDGPSDWDIDVGDELRHARSYIQEIGGDTVAHFVFIMAGADPQALFRIWGNWTETQVALTFGPGNDTFLYERQDLQPSQGASAGASAVQANVGTDLRLDATLGSAERGVVFFFEGRTNPGGVFGTPPTGEVWYERPDGTREGGAEAIEVSPVGGDWTFALEAQSDVIGADSPSLYGAVIDPAYLD